jgi:hypothetical protein
MPRRSEILRSSALLAAFAAMGAKRSGDEREERRWQYEALYGVGQRGVAHNGDGGAQRDLRVGGGYWATANAGIMGGSDE